MGWGEQIFLCSPNLLWKRVAYSSSFLFLRQILYERNEFLSHKLMAVDGRMQACTGIGADIHHFIVFKNKDVFVFGIGPQPGYNAFDSVE